MTLLQTVNLNARYGDFQALTGISVEIEDGEAVALIGSNGAGKSTFLRSIAGQLRAAPESIRYRNHPIGGMLPEAIVRQGIALVPEGRRLFPSLTVQENLAVGGYSSRPGPWTLDKVYALFPPLKGRAQDPASALSGGLQQMAAIGRALMANPDLLMCDEISLGLAPLIIRDLYATLRSIRAQGTTLLIVEQDINQAMANTDRVYCFQEGRISLVGRPADLSRDAIRQAYFGQ